MAYGALIEVRVKELCVLGILKGQGSGVCGCEMLWQVFLIAAAPGRPSLICAMWCLLVKLNLVKWEKMMIVIVSFKL